MSESQSTDNDGVIRIDVPIEITIRAGAVTVVSGAGHATSAGARALRPSRGDGGQPEAFILDEDYDSRLGYDDAHLGVQVPLPTLSEAQLKQASRDQTTDREDSHVLRYHHMSIVMNAKKRLAFFAACNTTRNADLIGSKSRTELNDGARDKWILDPRIPPAHQVQTKELYGPSVFDRGHLVRREDMYWGNDETLATYANFDSFHYTNCTPQHPEFNQSQLGEGLWGRLENHIAKSAATDGENLSYFAGPIFRRGRTMRNVFIPNQFFKVVLGMRRNGSLGAWAFRLSQKELVADAPEPVFAAGEFEEYLVSIASLERSTQLTFPEVVRKADVMSGQDDRMFDDLDEIPLERGS